MKAIYKDIVCYVKKQTIIQLPEKTYLEQILNGAGEGTRTLDPQLGRLTL